MDLSTDYCFTLIFLTALLLYMNNPKNERTINSTTSKNDTNEIPKYRASAPPKELRNSAQLISGDSTIFSIFIVAK